MFAIFLRHFCPNISTLPLAHRRIYPNTMLKGKLELLKSCYEGLCGAKLICLRSSGPDEHADTCFIDVRHSCAKITPLRLRSGVKVLGVAKK